MTTPRKFLIVGTYYNPGANALLDFGLRARAEVTLRAEPDNPYDPEAVEVLVEANAITPSEALDEALVGFGLTVATLPFPFRLGHLAAKYETKTAKRALAGGVTFSLAKDAKGLERGHLVFESNGSVMVEATS